jgi:hypothetical protein
MAERCLCVLGDRETSLCPRTVLGTDQAQRLALSSESQARVRSRTRQPWATSAADNRSESGCPIKAPGSGSGDLEALWRSLTQCMKHARAPLAGSSHDGPVRRQAPPLPSLLVGRTSPSRKPPCDGACHRRHRLTCGPVRSRFCLCHVFSPSGRGISAPPDGL